MYDESALKRWMGLEMRKINVVRFAVCSMGYL